MLHGVAKKGERGENNFTKWPPIHLPPHLPKGTPRMALCPFSSTQWEPLSSTFFSFPYMQETWVQSLGQEDPLEEGMATHSSILAWTIPIGRGAWQATVHRVTKSQAWLKWLSMYSIRWPVLCSYQQCCHKHPCTHLLQAYEFLWVHTPRRGIAGPQDMDMPNLMK